MAQLSTASMPARRASTSTESMRLRGRGLWLARGLWMVHAVWTVYIFLAGLPYLVSEARQQYATDYAAGLAALGLTADTLVAHAIALDVLLVGVFAAAALIIFWRRSDDPMALFVSGVLLNTGVTFARNYVPLLDLATQPLTVVVLASVWLWVSSVSRLAIFFLFPDGRFVPRWTWMLLALHGVFRVFSRLRDVVAPDDETLRIVLVVLDMILFVSGVLAQVYRFRRVATPGQRQQTKWIVYGMLVGVLAFYAYTFIPLLIPALRATDTTGTLYTLVAGMVRGVVLVVAPLAVTFAVLRHRLYDIDLVINRSLVYGSVTLVLGAAFVALVLGLERAFVALTGGQQPTYAVLAAALAIGALFPTARRAAQRLVDRHLFRLRVDLTQLEAPLPPPPNPGALTGAQLGGYTLISPLGRGGMSEVYKAEQTTLGRLVAVKVLSPALVSDAEFRARFEREARAIATLRHPNIVSVFDFGERDGTYYMAMEYIEGEELRRHLKREPRLSLDAALPIVRDVASALDHVHASNLVHRDVKPSNIMLRKPEAPDAPPRAVLMDFGIAKLRDTTSITQTGMIGTLDYVAPEQILSAREVDARADVYALGVVVYEMLTGEMPFRGEGVGQVLFAHLQRPAPDPRVLVPDLPPAVATAILRALSKTPDDRYPTAGAFAAALGG